MRIALALGARDPDSLDSYSGPQPWRTAAEKSYVTLDEVRRDATALRAQLLARHMSSSADEVRRTFLIGQLGAVVSRIDILRGARPAFADEARSLFGVDVGTVDAARMASIRSTLEQAVPGAGDLAERAAAFDRKFLVSRQRLPSVLARAVGECRERASAQVRLPAAEHVDVEFVPDMPWSAFTRYEGGWRSSLRINANIALSVDRALDLACHETYPGHHLIGSVVDERLVRGVGRIELTVQPLFSPQSLLYEAAASVAPLLAFSDEDRVAFERDVLFPLAGLDPSDAARYVRVARLVDRLHPVELDVARRYLDGELEFARASAALERDALMPFPDALLKFLNQFRSYAVTYTRGRDLFASQLAARSQLAHGSEARWRAYVDLISDPAQRLAY